MLGVATPAYITLHGVHAVCNAGRCRVTTAARKKKRVAAKDTAAGLTAAAASDDYDEAAAPAAATAAAAPLATTSGLLDLIRHVRHPGSSGGGTGANNGTVKKPVARSAAQQILTCNFPTLPKSRTVKYSAVALSAGTYDNVASVSTPGSNSKDDNVVVTAVSAVGTWAHFHKTQRSVDCELTELRRRFVSSITCLPEEAQQHLTSKHATDPTAIHKATIAGRNVCASRCMQVVASSHSLLLPLWSGSLLHA